MDTSCDTTTTSSATVTDAADTLFLTDSEASTEPQNKVAPYASKQAINSYAHANLHDLPNELLFDIINLIRPFIPPDTPRSTSFDLAHVNRRLRAFALPHAFESVKTCSVLRLTPLWTYFSHRPKQAALIKSLEIQVRYYDVPEASLEQQDVVATYPVSEFEHLGREICGRVHDIRLSKVHGILRNTIHLTHLSLSGLSLDYAIIMLLRELPRLVSLTVDHIEDYCMATDDEDMDEENTNISNIRSFHPPPLPSSDFPDLQQLCIKHHPRRYDLTNKDVTCYHPIHVLLRQCHTTLRHLRIVFCTNKEAESDESDFSASKMLNCKFPEGFFNLHSLTLEAFPIDFEWLGNFTSGQPHLRTIDLHPSAKFMLKDMKPMTGFKRAKDKKLLASISYLLDYVPVVEVTNSDGETEPLASSNRERSGATEEEEEESDEWDEWTATHSAVHVVELAVEMKTAEVTAGFIARLAEWFPHLRKLTLSSSMGTCEPFDVLIDELALFKHLTHLTLPWVPEDWPRTPDPRIFLMSRVINPPTDNDRLSTWHCLDCSLGICSLLHDRDHGTAHTTPIEEWRSDSEGAVSTAVQVLAKRCVKLEQFDWYPMPPSVGDRGMFWRWDITRQFIMSCSKEPRTDTQHTSKGEGKRGENGTGKKRMNWKRMYPHGGAGWVGTRMGMTSVPVVRGDLIYPQRQDYASEYQVPKFQCRVQGSAPTRWI